MNLLHNSYTFVLASTYDQLNAMMDELDNFYQKLGYNQTEEDFKARAMQLLTVGDYVATLWTDQMWYRARICLLYTSPSPRDS